MGDSRGFANRDMKQKGAPSDGEEILNRLTRSNQRFAANNQFDFEKKMGDTILFNNYNTKDKYNVKPI